MRTKTPIAMDEIPFAPMLGDTIPPSEPPPAPLPAKRPAECRVIAWRHDGGLDDTKHLTVERATAHAHGLHWAVYWKYALQCGRDMIARELIIQPLPHQDFARGQLCG
jgi:hypothetical protein